MTTISVDELVKAAELVKRLQALAACEANDIEDTMLEAAQTILSLSSRVEKAEAALREALAQIDAQASLLRSPARTLIPGDKP